MLIEALRAKGLPYAYLAFEGEQHGFRQASSIVRALESELWFYGRVFGFEPADDLAPAPAVPPLVVADYDAGFRPVDDARSFIDLREEVQTL